MFVRKTVNRAFEPHEKPLKSEKYFLFGDHFWSASIQIRIRNTARGEYPRNTISKHIEDHSDEKTKLEF
jgi:hypothetical protein